MSSSKGFGESGAAFEATPVLAVPAPVRATVSAEGRVLIPAGLREAAGIKKGDTVTLRVQDGVIIVEPLSAAFSRLDGAYAHLKKPGESVVDEFLKNRRKLWGEE